MLSFYTYMWLREDGTPYYIGKGSGNRAFRKSSPPVGRIILQEWPSEADAFEAEKFLISYYGRKDLGTGILRNLTEGGENPPKGLVKGKRWKLSAEACANIGRGATGRKWSDSQRANHIARQTGRKLSTEHRRSLSESHLGIVSKPAGWKHTEQAIAKMKDGRMRRSHSLETREKMSLAALGKKSPARAAAVRAWWAQRKENSNSYTTG